MLLCPLPTLPGSGIASDALQLCLEIGYVPGRRKRIPRSLAELLVAIEHPLVDVNELLRGRGEDAVGVLGDVAQMWPTSPM